MPPTSAQRLIARLDDAERELFLAAGSLAGLLRGVLQEHDREAMAALIAFADANGWRLAASERRTPSPRRWRAQNWLREYCP